MQEVRTDQIPLCFGRNGMRRQCLFHLGSTHFEDLEEVPVTTFEIFQHSANCCSAVAGSSPRTLSTMWLAQVLSVGLKSLGSVVGLKGRTTTLAESGRRCNACRFKNMG